MIRIRAMTAADIPLGMHLKSQAGWNQTEADWRRFLAMQPDGCFVAECDGAAVGTTVACIFDRVAWLAMVLVDTPMRGRGVGMAMLMHALAFLDRSGIRTVRLDATQFGQPLYEKLGFTPQYEVIRFAGVLPPPNKALLTATSHVETAGPEVYAELYVLDQTVVRTERGKFLFHLFQELPDAVRLIRDSGKVTGYLAVRSGSGALQIGPCISSTSAGPALLADAAQRHAGQHVMLDVPADNGPAIRFAESLQLERQRSFIRMYRGEIISDDLTRLWTSSGPELG